MELNPYKIMWSLVMFDLPTGDAKQRKQASGFRKFLLDNGFAMVNYSVYSRCCGKMEKVKRYTKLIEDNAPRTGRVSLLYFTDKQFENIKHFYNKEKYGDLPKKTEQLELFEEHFF